MLGSSRERIKVAFTENARVGSSRYRHRGPLMSQTFPIARGWRVCMSLIGEKETLTSFFWVRYL